MGDEQPGHPSTDLLTTSLINTFGVLSIVLVSSILLPQIRHNHKRQSTEGLSVGLIVLWHLSGAVFIAYAQFKNINITLAIGWICYSFESLVVEAQIVSFYPTYTYHKRVSGLKDFERTVAVQCC